MAPNWFVVTTMVVTSLMVFAESVVATVGVNYGMKGDNLPTPKESIDLIKSKGIPMVRLFEPNLDALDALKGSGMAVALGPLNKDISEFASNEQAAVDWLNTNVVPYIKDVDIKWITVGNEMIPGDDAQSILSAMQNMKKAVDAAGLSRSTFVSTVVSTQVLGTSYPPSAGAFSDDVAGIMTDIVSFVSQNGSPLMVNVYPYFAYAANPSQINLDFALLNASTAAYTDQGLEYFNLFDAMVDAFLAAIIKVGGSNDINIIVSESGWPSAGNGDIASIENAQTYNNNLKKHVTANGTPQRPDARLEAFIFALYNEDQKDNVVEQNFGTFKPNKEPVYPLW